MVSGRWRSADVEKVSLDCLNLYPTKFMVIGLEADQLASLASSLAPMHQSNGVRDTESGYRKPSSERIGQHSSWWSLCTAAFRLITSGAKAKISSLLGEELYRGFSKGLCDERAGAVWHGRMGGRGWARRAASQCRDLDPVLRFEVGSFGLTVATHEGWLLDVTVGEALT